MATEPGGRDYPNKALHPGRQVSRPVYGESNTWSPLRQAEEDAQNHIPYKPEPI